MEPQTIQSAAPLFDVQFVTPTQVSFARYLLYPLRGVRGLRSCGYSRWRTEFNEGVPSFRNHNPSHGASIGRVLVANSLYNLSDVVPSLSSYLDTGAPVPLFSRGVDALRSELQSDDPSVALEGGICLFQPGELLLRAPGKRSEPVDLYYGTHRSLEGGLLAECCEIECVCRRRGPSVQDYLHLYRLLAFAAALAAPVVVGVPDAEYMEEAIRALGAPLVERIGVADRIVESAAQIVQLAIRIGNRLGVEVHINYSGSDADVARAMRTARENIASSSVPRSMKRRDFVGYLAMPLVPKHLFNNRVTLGILPALEARTVLALAKAFPEEARTFVLFPELPNSEDVNVDVRCVRDQMSSAIEHAAAEDLNSI